MNKSKSFIILFSVFLNFNVLADNEYQCEYDFNLLTVPMKFKSLREKTRKLKSEKQKEFGSYMYKLIEDYQKNTLSYLELTDANQKAEMTKELERDYHIINACFSTYRKKYPSDHELVKSLIKSIKSLKKY